jgi:peptidyl-prolyl cis-trans isomerase SurA
MHQFFFIKKFLLSIFFLIACLNNVLSNEVSILFKIDNEIITNVDIENEYRYLTALNENLQSIEKSEVYEIAKVSIIKEVIKKIELKKYFILNENSEFIKETVERFYKSLNITSEKEFEAYLSQYNLKISDVGKKLEIEALWNELVFEKYNKQVMLDKDKLEKALKKKLSNNNNIQKKYFLSELLFNANNTSELIDQYNLIKKDIIEIGFENAANRYSQSDSARNGGNIGWIKDSQLSDIIREKIVNLKIGEISEIINILSGSLIIKVNDIKEEKIEIDFEEELKKFITFERNRQLNQFSIIYYNRIKQNSNFSEK